MHGSMSIKFTYIYKPRLKKEYIYAPSPLLGRHGPFQSELYLFL